jgi:hypothetical protein
MSLFARQLQVAIATHGVVIDDGRLALTCAALGAILLSAGGKKRFQRNLLLKLLKDIAIIHNYLIQPPDLWSVDVLPGALFLIGITIEHSVVSQISSALIDAHNLQNSLQIVPRSSSSSSLPPLPQPSDLVILDSDDEEDVVKSAILLETSRRHQYLSRAQYEAMPHASLVSHMIAKDKLL